MLRLFLAFLFLANVCDAQIKAVTETGEEVVLFENGTWKYSNPPDSGKKSISINTEKFVKKADATFLLKSTRVNVGFWLDPKKWQFKKGTEEAAQEFEIKLKNGDCYCVAITEKIEVPLESLKELALKNAQEAAPDAHISKEEFRDVNGLRVLFMKMDGTIKGIKFSYYGYYYSNKNGTVQFLCYTSQNLFPTYVKDMEGLLNGFVETKTDN